MNRGGAMARPHNQLTTKKVNSLKESGYYPDGNRLYLQVSKSLTKSWLFIYKLNSKKFEIGLGSTDTVTLAEAREKAQDYSKLLASGINPLIEKTQKGTRTASCQHSS